MLHSFSFDPSTDPIVVRLLRTLYERPPAAFVYIQRRILKRSPNIIVQDLGNLPFDQLVAQTEFQLGQHFSELTPNVIHLAFDGLRRRLGIGKSGVARLGSPGKKTLIDSLAIPVADAFNAQLMFADPRIAQAWEGLPESDAILLNFLDKNRPLLVSMIQSWLRCKEPQLVEDIAQETVAAAMLLFDPKYEWSFAFIERIAANLLHTEWTRRRKWPDLHHFNSVRFGRDEADPSVESELPLRRQHLPVPEPAAESLWDHPLELGAEALRTVAGAHSHPLNRAMFIATVLLKWKPSEIVEDYSEMYLADFVDLLEAEFDRRSRLPDTVLSTLFHTLRQDLTRPVSDGRPGQILGTTRIADYYRSTDPTRQANDVSGWAENAQRYLFAEAVRPDSPLFQMIWDERPGWRGSRRKPAKASGRPRAAKASLKSTPRTSAATRGTSACNRTVS